MERHLLTASSSSSREVFGQMVVEAFAGINDRKSRTLENKLRRN
jgi:hypothetical protein